MDGAETLSTKSGLPGQAGPAGRAGVSGAGTSQAGAAGPEGPVQAACQRPGHQLPAPAQHPAGTDCPAGTGGVDRPHAEAADHRSLRQWQDLPGVRRWPQRLLAGLQRALLSAVAAVTVNDPGQG